MANTTTTSLKLTVQATGDNSGTWGQITNTNLQILEQAIGGYDAVGITSGATLSFTNGTLSNGKNQVLKLTGTISGNVNVIIPDSVEKTYIVENATTGAHTVTFKTSSGSGITFSSTDKGKKILYSDGTNVLEGVTSVGNLTTGSVTATGNITTTGTITSTGALTGPLNATCLTSGTVPDARITGAYTGLTNLTMSGDLTVDTDTLVVDASANTVGINTASASRALHVVSSQEIVARLESSGAASRLKLIDSNTTSSTNAPILSSAGDLFMLNTGGAERLRVLANGNVGIANTNPSEKLEVTGTVKATAFEGDGSALTGISAGLVNLGTTNVSAASAITISLPSAYKKFFVTVGGIRTGSQSQLTPNLRVGVSGSIKTDTKYIFQGLQYSSPSAAGTITTDSVVNLNNASFAALGLSSLFDTTTASNWNAQFEIDTGTSLSFPCINYSAFYSRNSSQSNGVASGRIFYKDETTIDTIQLTTSSGVNWAADGNVTVWGLK
tara:strand:+ start:1236 stop:2732 length:1497 start_codon:yes stop_codon:yes gene_type:complete